MDGTVVPLLQYKKWRLAMMNALPAMIVVWAVLTGLFLALLAYNATITRYEENQLFLDNINNTEQEEQSAILRKVNMLVPFLRVLGSLSGVMAVAIVVMYTWDCWRKIQGGQ